MLDLSAFGAMISAARRRRGWRPIDLAMAMGWSGTAPVYRIERPGPDAPRPHPDTVNLLAQTLDLDYADRMTLLGFAGHVMDTEPLTAREEARVVGWAHSMLGPAPDPTFLVDFRDRILAINGGFRWLLGWDSNAADEWLRRGITNLDLLWDPALGLRQRHEHADAVAEALLMRFKLYNRLRRHEAWYRAYPGCRAHLPGFVESWERTEQILDGPAEEWELDDLVSTLQFAVVGPQGERWRFESSVRLLHAGYGLIRVVRLDPRDRVTRCALAID
jgi:hypothetical protein